MQGYTVLNSGQILLTEDTSNQYAGDIVNTQDEIDLNVVLNWHGLDRYPASDLINLPVPHVDVYDRTDPANPKLVRENTPMRLEEDPTVPGRASMAAEALVKVHDHRYLRFNPQANRPPSSCARRRRYRAGCPSGRSN